jgi:hypothetical protein
MNGVALVLIVLLSITATTFALGDLVLFLRRLAARRPGARADAPVQDRRDPDAYASRL